ncbi:MAG: enoyl-CoA hydratase-related protein, partial [Myxococcota bacterium]
MSGPTVLVETKEWVRTLTFNRPEARNAFNSQQYRELFEALGEAERDDSVRVVVLTGA